MEFEFERPKPVELFTPDEIFQQADSATLSKFYENSKFERKSAAIHARELAEYYSMFANTKPDGGVIAIGVRNDGTLEGCGSLQPERLNRIEQAGQYCSDAKHASRHVPFQRKDGDQDFVILVRVFYNETRLVETADGNAFIRRGSSKYKLRNSEKMEIRASKGEISFELEPCPGMRYPMDFDQDLIGQFVEAYHSKKQLDERHSHDEVLELCHLGRRRPEGFEPNLACALAFANDPRIVVPGCRVRFLRFEGEHEGTGERFNPVKDLWIEGPVPRLIVKAAEALSTQLRDFSKLGKDGKFYTAPEYPPFAWYEAVVNACVHRSYSLRNMSIFVKLFDDRMVVESPGGFPGVVTPDNIYEISDPRNPRLMDIMFYLDFVKAAHEGARRMRDTMLEMQLPPPEFEQKEIDFHLVRVTLRNNIKQRKVWIDADVSGLVGEAVSRSLSDDERRVINFVAENGKINVSQVTRLTSRTSWPAAKKLLDRLVVERGIFERVSDESMERDPNAHYRLRRP